MYNTVEGNSLINPLLKLIQIASFVEQLGEENLPDICLCKLMQVLA